MDIKYKYVNKDKVIIILSILLLAWATTAIAEARSAPQDNDAVYTIPTYIPRAAMPKTKGKVIFNDTPQDNDALYVLPREVRKPKSQPKKKANPKTQPAKKTPAAPPTEPNVEQLKQLNEWQRQEIERLRIEQYQLYQQQLLEQYRQQQQNGRGNNNRPIQEPPKEDYYPNYYY